MGHREIEAAIPYRGDETGPHDDDKDFCRERPLTERTIGRPQCFRRVATRCNRCDTLASDNLALVTFAMILAWL
jgi:hypothetical protein